MGVRQIGHLHRRNVCRDIDVIKSLLLGLERADCLQLTSDYPAVSYRGIRLYHSARPFSPPPSTSLGCVPTLRHRESPLSCDTSWAYIYKCPGQPPSAMANVPVLRAILRMNAY
ncbi:hypothetical protein VCUG_02181 [Vavraia culicis subsp. floridensis]|uniref:Uncharacterized protein n=1 Tax=Vavraia culicis (isolate floridensis) TaxID=948595 RepID=L2GRQ9_VAVCU|nr:uncharacterized protein VCUG_02181 [Vavraia culicis subsp. floridensis]ELA46336.1 hypothetical protein VCUG_02181 [Vavraia culicis subsp. floridensis]